MDFESNILNPDIYHDIMNWIRYIKYDIIWYPKIGNLTSINVYRSDNYKYQFNNVIIVLDT